MIKSFSGMTLSNESVTGESMEDEAATGMKSSFKCPTLYHIIHVSHSKSYTGVTYAMRTLWYTSKIQSVEL